MAAFADFWILATDLDSKEDYEKLLELHQKSQRMEANTTYTQDYIDDYLQRTRTGTSQKNLGTPTFVDFDDIAPLLRG